MANESTAVQLPIDWWRRQDCCLGIRDYLKKHIVGLHVGIVHNDEQKDMIISCLLVHHKGLCLLITAAHAIKTLEELLGNSNVEIDHADIFDNENSDSQSSFSVNLENMPRLWVNHDGMDVGALVLRPAYSELLLKNSQNKFLDFTKYECPEGFEIDGYCLLGYPHEWIETMQRYKKDGEPRRQMRYGIACVPFEYVDDLGTEANAYLSDFWGHQECFYGKLLSFVNTSRDLVENVSGMSGGPVVAVGRSESGKMAYHICGIQSQWMPNSRIIRVVHNYSLDAFLDVVDERMKEDSNEGEGKGGR